MVAGTAYLKRAARCVILPGRGAGAWVWMTTSAHGNRAHVTMRPCACIQPVTYGDGRMGTYAYTGGDGQVISSYAAGRVILRSHNGSTG